MSRVGSESGSALVGLVVVLIAIAGLAIALLSRTTASSTASSSSAELSRLLFVSEAGLNYNFMKLSVDPLYVIKDTTGFSWNHTTMEFESKALSLQTEVSSKQQTFTLAVQYLEAGVPVSFADRSNPTESVDEIRVGALASTPRANRTVTVWYEYSSGYKIGGAIVCDMIPTGSLDLGTGAKDNGKIGHLAFEDKLGGKTQFHVFGDILSNGTAAFEDPIAGLVVLTEANVDNYFAIYDGTLSPGLEGTDEEIPDYTTIGSAQQLFDFDRIENAAKNGAGKVFANVKEFEVDMAAANAASVPLEGVIVIHINMADTFNNYDISENVNITGTLMVRFKDGTDPLDKIQMLADCNINPADLSGVDPMDVSTYTTGYPGTYLDPSKKPSAVSLSGSYEDFKASEDLPAMMYNNAVLDIHGSVNICGVVYAASFLELENKFSGIHYLNGAIFAGGGIFIEAGKFAGSKTMIRFDPNTVDKLETLGDGSGGSLVRTGYAVSQ